MLTIGTALTYALSKLPQGVVIDSVEPVTVDGQKMVEIKGTSDGAAFTFDVWQKENGLLYGEW